MKNTFSLTKSTYKIHMQCQAINQYSIGQQVSESYVENNRKKEGIAIEEESKKYFNELIDSNHLHIEIQNYRNTILYQPEATIEFKGSDIRDIRITNRADYLFIDKDGNYHLIEVKGKTDPYKKNGKLKDDIKHDLTYQKYVFEKYNIPIKTVSLLYLNNDYTKKEKTIISELFIKDDVTHLLEYQSSEIEEEISRIISIIQKTSKPIKTISKGNCRDCPYKQTCHSEEGLTDEIFEIPDIRGKDINILTNNNITNLKDVGKYIKLNPNKESYIQVTRTNKPIINIDAIRNELKDFKKGDPIYSLDYETLQPPIPEWEGFRPYQQIPMQYHISKLEQNNITHKYYLHNKNSNPLPRLLENLKSDIGNEGLILVYFKRFEQQRNNEMGLMYPEYASFLESVNNRMFDLEEIFKISKGYYIHPDFKGRSTLKLVLPVFSTEQTYTDIEISGGMTARYKWHEMTADNINDTEKKKIYKDLLEYCRLDTEGLLIIYKSLMELI
ncbi:MAG: hypothetical protein CL730_03305 [Chloroflexi bacterium]|nr:hypothetical protein [Chloroflexota bacterium]